MGGSASREARRLEKRPGTRARGAYPAGPVEEDLGDPVALLASLNAAEAETAKLRDLITDARLVQRSYTPERAGRASTVRVPATVRSRRRRTNGPGWR